MLPSPSGGGGSLDTSFTQSDILIFFNDSKRIQFPHTSQIGFILFSSPVTGTFLNAGQGTGLAAGPEDTVWSEIPLFRLSLMFTLWPYGPDHLTT